MRRVRSVGRQRELVLKGQPLCEVRETVIILHGRYEARGLAGVRNEKTCRGKRGDQELFHSGSMMLNECSGFAQAKTPLQSCFLLHVPHWGK